MAVKPVVYDDSSKKHRPLGSGERMDGLSASSIISSDSGNLIQTGTDGLAYVSGSSLADPRADNLLEESAGGRLQVTVDRIAEWLDGHPQDAAALMDSLNVVSSDAGNILAEGSDGGALLTGAGLADAVASLPDSARAVLAGAVADYISSAGSDVGGASATAEGSTEPRSLSERFGDLLSPEDFGAEGDGQTDDTQAFEALEEAVSGVRVNLHGRTYKVYTPPCGNYYYNGFWKQDVSYNADPLDADSTVPAYDDNVRMQYGSVHRAGAGTHGRNYCVLNNASLEDVWKTNLKDVVAIGEDTLKAAMEAHDTVSGCVAIGRGALAKSVGIGYQNIAIGNFALRCNTGDRNVAIGSLAMLFNVTGRQTIALGRDVAQCMVRGAKNTFLGYGALGGAAPVGISTWIERQNQVEPIRMTVVGSRAAQALSGTVKDAVIIGAFSAYNAKTASKNVVIGASACKNIGSDRSYEGYDEWRAEAVAISYSTDGVTPLVHAVYPADTPTPAVGEEVMLTVTDNESPLYGMDNEFFAVTAVSGTDVYCKLVDPDAAGGVSDEPFDAYSGTAAIAQKIPCTYTTSGSDEIVLTVASPSVNKAVLGRRAAVSFIAESGDAVPVSGEGGWLRVKSVTSTTITVVDDNLDTEGNSNPEFPAGSGRAFISAFELGTTDCLQNKFDLSVAVGYGVCMNSESLSQSCVTGYSAAGNVSTLYRAAVYGYKAGISLASISESVLVGAFAGGSAGAAVADSVLVGKSAGGGSGCNGSVVIGSSAGVIGTLSDLNTIVGYYAGNGITVSGSRRNVAVGYHAMSVNPQDGAGNDIVIEDSISIGEYSNVTGSQQFQLGGTGTTAYAYGSVQDRSDARDKADVRDTALGLDFLKALRPVDFRWDYREDYVDYVEREDGTVGAVRREKDGSRKRVRFHHGLIAQEVKAAMDAQGIDFGGYQDHKINGGADVLTIGYEELVAPIVKAIQQIDARLSALES